MHATPSEAGGVFGLCPLVEWPRGESAGTRVRGCSLFAPEVVVARPRFHASVWSLRSIVNQLRFGCSDFLFSLGPFLLSGKGIVEDRTATKAPGGHS